MTKGIDSGIGVLVPVGTQLKNLQQDIKDALAVDSDGFKEADSIAELAKKINVPAKNLEATVAEYNKTCELQHDPVFLKDRRYLKPINGKKYYALKLKSYFFSAYGGLVTNRQHQVLDTHHKPIPGLYAAGLKSPIWSDRPTLTSSPATHLDLLLIPDAMPQSMLQKQ